VVEALIISLFTMARISAYLNLSIILKLLSCFIDPYSKVSVVFKKIDENTAEVTETFEMESTNSEELQRQGCQAILESFKLYTESI
jgi:hypothetical protein